MNARIFLLFVFVLSFVGSCQRGEQEDDMGNLCNCTVFPFDTLTHHYIKHYLLTIDSVNTVAFKPEDTGLWISLQMHGEEVWWPNEPYAELAIKFDDFHFNDIMIFGASLAIWVDTLTAFTVTCNKDYNAAYPAGKALDRIVRFSYSSAQEAFDSSFELDAVTHHIKAEEIWKNLTAFNGQPHPLLGNSFMFVFEEPTTLKEDFDLTFTAYKNEQIVFEKILRVSYLN
jgi:hypothetical protein